MGLGRLRERLADAFWVVPAACVLFAGVLALGLIRVDEGLQRGASGISFTGGPSSARSLLGAIASSMLTLTALVFSITLVVLQLASSQFSPRVLRTFLHDRRIQLTLGIFTGTFVYALVVLRAVRGEDGLTGRFVPGVAVTVCFALAVLSVALLVAYIHHITQSIRAVNIIAKIGAETRQTIEREHLAGGDDVAAPRAPDGDVRSISSQAAGVVVLVQVRKLVQLAERADASLRLVPRIGDFVPRGGRLFEVAGGSDLDEEEVRDAVLLGQERSVSQDVAFGFRQLVDIAEKALSPGVNDPTTAVQCLDQVHDLLRQLAVSPYPTGSHLGQDGHVRLAVPPARWEDHVALALDEVRHWGAGSLQVHRRIRSLLLDLLAVAGPDRRPPLQRQLDLLARRAADLPEVERCAVASGGRPGSSEAGASATAGGAPS